VEARSFAASSEDGLSAGEHTAFLWPSIGRPHVRQQRVLGLGEASGVIRPVTAVAGEPSERRPCILRWWFGGELVVQTVLDLVLQ
jgi:hypothetical protein